MNTEEELIGLDDRLPADEFIRTVNLYLYGNPNDGRPLPPPAIETDTPQPRAQTSSSSKLDDPRAGALFTRTESECLADILAMSIEEK